MPTSGVTAWELTALDVIAAAMKELAVLDPGSDPDADEAVDCMLRLNGMLKSWSMQGVTLYRQGSTTAVTTPAVASVALPAGVRSVSSARVVVSATNERRLWPMGRTDYLNLPNKVSAGSPTMFYLDRQSAAPVLYLWPVSASAVTIKLDYDRVPETVTNLAETIDIREELQETVYAGLAVRIAGIFQVPIPAELASRAALLEQQMMDAERPDSYHFETDYDYSCA